MWMVVAALVQGLWGTGGPTGAAQGQAVDAHLKVQQAPPPRWRWECAPPAEHTGGVTLPLLLGAREVAAWEGVQGLK